MTDTYDQAQLKELLLQMVETELGGEQVYLQALESVVNDDLRKEWQGYLEETLRHQDILRRVCDALDIDESEQSPGRQVVAHIGQSLVVAMRIAREAGDPEAAERVACECVVLAETKDHSNWELLGRVADQANGGVSDVLSAACDAVEEDEHHHLYHTMGWCRELWIQALGLPAVLPPPEEEKHVKTAIGAARAEQQREDML